MQHDTATVFALLLFLGLGCSVDSHDAMSGRQPLLATQLPDVAGELEELLRADGLEDLAGQIPTLRIVDRCRCDDSFCAMLYTVPPPEGGWGPGHENIVLSPDRGDMILDLVDRTICAIEILDRDDVRARLLELLP